MIYENISNVLPEAVKLKPQDQENVGILCNIRVETLRIVRVKLYVLLLISFFIFSMFVMTNACISIVLANYPWDNSNKSSPQAISRDNAMYVVYTITVIYSVFTMIGLVIVFCYSVLHIHRIKKHLEGHHNIFKFGYHYGILFGVSIIFYLMCCIRSALLIDCKRPNPMSSMCFSIFRYTAAIDIIYTLCYLMICVWMVIIVKMLMANKINSFGSEKKWKHRMRLSSNMGTVSGADHYNRGTTTPSY